MNNYEKSFELLGLSSETLKGIKEKGFEEATEIQSKAIPFLLNSRENLIAQAQTGTGKTAAFGLPLIESLDAKSKNVQAIILVPTRELALQVSDEINSFKGKSKLKIIPVYGGQSIEQQIRRLNKGVQIVVGTPGRIIDHLKRGTLDLARIKELILDEADEMLNMGFVEDIEEILKFTNDDRRVLLFSATMPERIKTLVKKYVKHYETIKIKKEQITTKLTNQIYFEVRASDKFEALCRIIDIEEEFYGLIFCRTKRDVDQLYKDLVTRGYDAEAIHGDISQAQRERVLSKFKNNIVNILVATDVAARGIDVNNLTHVINYALPQDPESYIHRIGRTGRAGKEGTAITFITPSEYSKLMFIQKVAKSKIKKYEIPKVSEIIKAKKNNLKFTLNEMIKDGIDKKYLKWAEELLNNNTPQEVLGALLSFTMDSELDESVYGEIGSTTKGRSKIAVQGKARLFINLGKKDKMTKRMLVDKIKAKVSIKTKFLKDIQVLDNFSFVTVPFERADEIIEALNRKSRREIASKAKKVK